MARLSQLSWLAGRGCYFLCLAVAFCITIVSGISTAQKHPPQTPAELSLSFAPVVRSAAPAVVNISTSRLVQERIRHPFADDPFFKRFFGDLAPFGRSRERNVQSLGSGVLLRDSGILVTNAHVIAQADEIRVSLSDGREFAAELLLSDEAVDLAFLKIEPDETPLPTLELDIDEKEVGDLVLAIGNPWGLGKTVTSGIISALARTNVVDRDISYFIQTDAAINPGNSGGALVGIDGRLIGINTAIFTKSGGSQGIGFAIPARMVAALLRNLDTGQSRPWFGAKLQPLDRPLAQGLGFSSFEGAIVTELNDLSPLSGQVEIGDVITAINGEQVRDPASVLYHYATSAIGDSIDLKLWRNGRDINIRIRVIAPPESPPRNLTILRGNHPMDGIEVGQLSPALAAELGLKSEAGIIVMAFEADSLGQRYGFKQGDIILGLEGRLLSDISELINELGRPAQSWRILISRDGRTLRLAFRR